MNEKKTVQKDRVVGRWIDETMSGWERGSNDNGAAVLSGGDEWADDAGRAKVGT